MKLSSVIDAFGKVGQIARLNGYPLFASYLRFFKLVQYGLYSPTEIYMTDMLDPDMPDDELSKLISKESFLRFQLSLNPSTHLKLTEDKIEFNTHCLKHDLPVPDLIAVIKANGNSYWANDKEPLTKHPVDEKLKNYPIDLICKPAAGFHGRDVASFSFINGEIHYSDVLDMSLIDFMEKLQAESKEDYIIQKKLYCHQKLATLTDNQRVQSLRIETYLDEDGRPQMVSRSIKFPDRSAIVDNFVFGITNCRLCYVDKEGYLTNTIRYLPEIGNLTMLDYVENSRGEKVAFKLPYWQQCVELALDAQVKFAPLKTVGWDIAITDHGPFLIEGNAYWDPPLRLQGPGIDLLKTLNVPIQSKYGVSRYRE